jgi:hypothetical protein
LRRPENPSAQPEQPVASSSGTAGLSAHNDLFTSSPLSHTFTAEQGENSEGGPASSHRDTLNQANSAEKILAQHLSNSQLTKQFKPEVAAELPESNSVLPDAEAGSSNPRNRSEPPAGQRRGKVPRKGKLYLADMATLQKSGPKRPRYGGWEYVPEDEDAAAPKSMEPVVLSSRTRRGQTAGQ